jgi:hypothetical protein
MSYPKPKADRQIRPLKTITHVITAKIFIYYNFVIRYFKRNNVGLKGTFQHSIV